MVNNIAAFYENVWIYFVMESETLNFARYLGVYFFIHLFLHNFGVPNANLSNDILYLIFFTFKLAKQAIATKNTYVTQHAKTRLFSKIKFFSKNPPSDSALCSVHFKTNCMKIGRVFPKIQLLKTKKSNRIFWHSTIEKTVFKGNH